MSVIGSNPAAAGRLRDYKLERLVLLSRLQNADKLYLFSVCYLDITVSIQLCVLNLS